MRIAIRNGVGLVLVVGLAVASAACVMAPPSEGGSGGEEHGGGLGLPPEGGEGGECDDGDGDDGMCVAQGDSCAEAGSECCPGLHCCAGVPVPPGQEFCSDTCPISDENLKESFSSVEQDDVLERAASLPVSIWSYRSDGDFVTHMGPMAQDFHAAFGIGSTDRYISPVDSFGVTLASIQALHRQVRALEADRDALRMQIQDLQRGRRSRSR